MSMTKMDCAVDYEEGLNELNYQPSSTLEALRAGNEAIDLLQEIYYKFEKDRSLQASYLSVQIRELLEEWN